MADSRTEAPWIRLRRGGDKHQACWQAIFGVRDLSLHRYFQYFGSRKYSHDNDKINKNDNNKNNNNNTKNNKIVILCKAWTVMK